MIETPSFKLYMSVKLHTLTHAKVIKGGRVFFKLFNKMSEITINRVEKKLINTQA